MLGALGGSPAARAGVRYGDVLISVNGVRTRTIVDYLRAKALRVDGMEIVVFRGGAESTRDLEFTGDGTAPDLSAILTELVMLRVGEVDDGDARELSDLS